MKFISAPLDHPMIDLAMQAWPLAAAIAAVWALSRIRGRGRRSPMPVVVLPPRAAPIGGPSLRRPIAARRPAPAAAGFASARQSANRAPISALSGGGSLSTCRVCGEPLDLRAKGAMCACDR